MTQIININKVQTMTSLEIAELTGKQHKNVMQAIRNMEPAWEKVTGLKFQLCEKSYLLANGVTKKQPFYQLTKTECLYIATKFNDEARARMGVMQRRRTIRVVFQKDFVGISVSLPIASIKTADFIG